MIYVIVYLIGFVITFLCLTLQNRTITNKYKLDDITALSLGSWFSLFLMIVEKLSDTKFGKWIERGGK